MTPSSSDPPHEPRGPDSTTVAHGPREAADGPSSRGGAHDARTAADPHSIERTSGAERVQALTMLLPAAVLAWPGPGSFLRDDFLPAATGSAVVLLCTLPAVFVLALRGMRGGSRAWIAWLLLALAFPIARAFPAGTVLGDADALGRPDGFENARALLLVLAAAALAACGASLGVGGRRTFARGLCVVSIAYTLLAHFDTARSFTGALGNTGSVSQAALAGAVVGAGMLLERRGPWSALYGAAFVLELAYAWRVPVIAGALACAAGLLAIAVFARKSGRTTRVRVLFAVLAVIAALGAFLPLAHVTSSTDDRSLAATSRSANAAAVPATPPGGDTGGIAVRELVWKSTLRMIAAHPWTGVGLGQFARDFPPFRDPREIELSTHQRRIAQETEVEHAHSDLLTLLAEGGIVFGGIALLFLGLVLTRALKSMRSEVAVDVALSAAAVALLANACVHGVLFYDPVSGALAFGVFGTVLGRVAAPARAWTRLVPWILLAGLCAAAPLALSMVRHARELGPIYRGEGLSTSATGQVLDAALEARGDSTLALSLKARSLELRRVEPKLIAAAWDRVRERRPFRVEALMQAGLARLQSGDESEVLPIWSLAKTLDPSHPGLTWNLMALACDEERLDDARALLAELDARSRVDPERVGALAVRLELEAKETCAQSMWERAAPDIASAGPDKAFQLAKDQRQAGNQRLASALELRAQRGFAREHAAAGRWSDAVRSYRQAVRASSVDGAPAPTRLGLELAAALSMAGRDDEAREEAGSLRPTQRDLASIPAWAREQAEREGWVPR